MHIVQAMPFIHAKGKLSQAVFLFELPAPYVAPAMICAVRYALGDGLAKAASNSTFANRFAAFFACCIPFSVNGGIQRTLHTMLHIPFRFPMAKQIYFHGVSLNTVALYRPAAFPARALPAHGSIAHMCRAFYLPTLSARSGYALAAAPAYPAPPSSDG